VRRNKPKQAEISREKKSEQGHQMRKTKMKEEKSAQIAGEIKNKEKIKHNKTHVDII